MHLSFYLLCCKRTQSKYYFMCSFVIIAAPTNKHFIYVILFSFQDAVKESTPSVPKRSHMHLDFNDPLDVSFIRKEVNASYLVESETPESDNTQLVARSLDATLRCLSVNETFASIQGDPFASESQSQTDSTSSFTSSDEQTSFSTRQVLLLLFSLQVDPIILRMKGLWNKETKLIMTTQYVNPLIK